MLSRTLEPEVMDTIEESLEYDAMDHSTVNERFVLDLLEHESALQCVADDAQECGFDEVLDVGTGTARIPIELARRHQLVRIMAVDLSPSMLDIAKNNIELAGVTDSIQLDLIDAKQLIYEDGRFSAVISNSIVHHIPDPRSTFAEAVRVTQSGGLLFFRDLLRPDDEATIKTLVETYAGDESDRARQLFDDSLRAALRVEEVQSIIESLGFDPSTVTATSDRHWTWNAIKS